MAFSISLLLLISFLVIINISINEILLNSFFVFASDTLDPSIPPACNTFDDIDKFMGLLHDNNLSKYRGFIDKCPNATIFSEEVKYKNLIDKLIKESFNHDIDKQRSIYYFLSNHSNLFPIIKEKLKEKYLDPIHAPSTTSDSENLSDCKFETVNDLQIIKFENDNYNLLTQHIEAIIASYQIPIDSLNELIGMIPTCNSEGEFHDQSITNVKTIKYGDETLEKEFLEKEFLQGSRNQVKLLYLFKYGNKAVNGKQPERVFLTFVDFVEMTLRKSIPCKIKLANLSRS